MQRPAPNNSARGRYFRRFLAYALNYKPLIFLSLGIGVFKFVLVYIYPWLVGAALDNVVAPEARGLDHTLAERVEWLWWLIGIGVVATFLRALATFGRGYFTAKLGNRVIADLRQDLFDHLHRLSLHFYSRERTGSIVSRLITDIQEASRLITGGAITVVMDMAQTLVGLVILFMISWRLALACLIIMPLYAITFKVLNPRVKQASRRVQSQISKITGNVQERLAGIALVKTYAAEKREQESFYTDTEEHFGRVLHRSRLAQLVNGISEGLVHFGQIIVIGFGGYLALFGTPPLTAGEIAQFLGTLSIMYNPVQRFAQVNVIYQTSLAAIERVFQILDITPKITEKPDAVKGPPQHGEVRFEEVYFNYSDDDSDESLIRLEEQPMERLAAERQRRSAAAGDGNGRAGAKPAAEPQWVLHDLTFTVAPGERVALVGPSGSGKTTLVSLLPRLYDVAAGRILIDGVDVRDYRRRPLRRAIGIVQQDSFLFTGSIRENLAYGRPNATDDEIYAAAQAANAHNFILDLPEGYDTQLGERGVNLSGGQRQRLSIARAILKDPKILILDEATSALDSESEALVQEALGRLMRNRTCFIIAHRLSTVRDVDRILVLQHGRLIESGTHDELLAKDGLYARLVRQQFGLYADPVAVEE